jgi:hypothetical protein
MAITPDYHCIQTTLPWQQLHFTIQLCKFFNLLLFSFFAGALTLSSLVNRGATSACWLTSHGTPLAAGLCLDCSVEGFKQHYQMTVKALWDGAFPEENYHVSRSSGNTSKLIGVSVAGAASWCLRYCTRIAPQFFANWSCWVDLGESFGAQRFCTFQVIWLILRTL